MAPRAGAGRRGHPLVVSAALRRGLTLAAPRTPPSMRAVHIRRALLLFAIVLGMGALVASLSRPPAERSRTEPREEPSPGPATATPAPADTPPRPVSFNAAADER